MRVALILVGAVLSASAGASPRTGVRAGRVVRIERKPAGPTGTPRYCTVSINDNVGYCITPTPPEIGSRMTVIDNARVLGTIRISSVQGIADGCNQNTSWMTQGTLESGDLSTPNGAIIGVIDVGLDPRNAKLVNVDKSPSGHPIGTDTIYAIDNNNDGAADLEFVQFGCDDAGNMSPMPTGLCNEVWSAKAPRGMERVRAERVRTCY
ncbi:MAG: hypothetical protein HOV81_35135 [Kofleriaceae bacterium]|nr:hypothetical protein [Kofleriaceae bacterium]